MNIIGIESDGLGTNNQIRGLVMAGAKADKKRNDTPISRQALLKAEDGTLLHPKNFATTEEFFDAVQKAVDKYVSEASSLPDYVVLPFGHAAEISENQAVDTMSLAVKNAFKKHNASVKTMALASNLYNYQNVDLIHVGAHLLSDADEKKLQTDKELAAKTVKTLGVPSNINWATIRNLANQENVKEVIDVCRKKKNMLFSLGGMTDNGAIGFGLEDAEKLFQSAIKLKAKGYNVIFTNSPRTPSDVTDFLYEKCKVFNMPFFNSKKIAQNEEEAKNFRNYDGKHKKEFSEQAEKIGNVYPAILDVCEFVVNTHDSFSYTSDAAVLGIPSVVYTGNFIDKERRPDCYKLFELCQSKGHVKDLKAALLDVDSKRKIQTVKMDDVSLQLVRAMQNSLEDKTRTIGKQYE